MCRSFARHPAGRGRCLADDDRTDRSLLRHRTQMARGGQRLWIRPPTSRLAGQRAGIAPHVPVIDKSQREDADTFSREDLPSRRDTRHLYMSSGRDAHHDWLYPHRSRAAVSSTPGLECRACPLKTKCCPNMPARRIKRDVNEAARDVARALAKTHAFAQSRRDRKKVEMLFAHLKRIPRLGRLRLRDYSGAQFEFTLAAIAQNLRRLAKLVARPPPITSAARVA